MWPREQLVETDVKDTVIIIIIINTIITIIIKDVKDTVITLPNIINTILVSLLIKEVSKNIKEKPGHIEGENNKEWILLDYFDVVIHIFNKEKRDFYKLENLWADANIQHIEQSA